MDRDIERKNYKDSKILLKMLKDGIDKEEYTQSREEQSPVELGSSQPGTQEQIDLDKDVEAPMRSEDLFVHDLRSISAKNPRYVNDPQEIEVPAPATERKPVGNDNDSKGLVDQQNEQRKLQLQIELRKMKEQQAQQQAQQQSQQQLKQQAIQRFQQQIQQQRQQQLHMQHISMQMQQPISLFSQHDNYRVLYELLESFNSVLAENDELKQEIWENVSLISMELQRDYDEQYTKLDKKQSKPGPLSRNNSYDVSYGNFKYAAELKEIELPDEDTITKDGGEGLSYKQAKLAKLRSDNKRLKRLHQMKRNYNSELLKVIDEYETSMIEVINELAADFINLDKRQLKNVEEKNKILEMKKEKMYNTFLEICRLTESTCELYNSFQGFVEGINNNEEFSQAENLAKILLHLKQRASTGI